MKKGALRERREQAGMTQEELSTKIGCGVVSIQNWESGKTLPNASFGVKLCEEFGLSMDELYFGKARLTLSHKYENLTEEEIEYILDVLNTIRPDTESTFGDIIEMIDLAAGRHRRKPKRQL